MNKIAEHKKEDKEKESVWKSSGTIWISHSPRTLFGIGFMPMHIPFLPRLFSRLNNLVLRFSFIRRGNSPRLKSLGK